MVKNSISELDPSFDDVVYSEELAEPSMLKSELIVQLSVIFVHFYARV